MRYWERNLFKSLPYVWRPEFSAEIMIRCVGSAGLLDRLPAQQQQHEATIAFMTNGL